LKATTLKKQNQGEEGKFNYTYSAESKPSGKPGIKIEDTETEVTLKPKISEISLLLPGLPNLISILWRQKLPGMQLSQP
jgi:hypothetical protein